MYYAELDENNKVIRVIVSDQSFTTNLGGNWVNAEANNFASIGSKYDEERNAFISE